MARILIIDDSKSVHAFVKMCFGDTHHIVDVYDGQEALPLFGPGTEPFDLVLMDWEMPILNGPETMAALATLSNKTPVIMMTSRNSFEDISLMLNLGAQEYIIKPFTKDILLSKIALVMKGALDDVA